MVIWSKICFVTSRHNNQEATLKKLSRDDIWGETDFTKTPPFSIQLLAETQKTNYNIVKVK